ncbi:MAG: PH domain-containing protein [Candidatus Schekmanbacteria bacterium]|nr:PH domain-containing protein [Candidatus Schekmanbacteria bacterium]
MSSERLPFALATGEHLLCATRPHVFAMVGLMLFWLGTAALGASFIIWRDDLLLVPTRLPLGELLSSHFYSVVWFTAVLVPMVVMALRQVRFGYVLTLLALTAGHLLLRCYVEPQLALPHYPHLENLMLIAVGLLGVVGCEIFRRGHRYYVTSHRIIARFGRLRLSERNTFFSKIDDLLLSRSLFGRLVGFGTVIPVTATGIGMGQDLAVAGVDVRGGSRLAGAGLFAAGGKTVNVPRELSMYVLYKIPAPERVRNLIIEQMHRREAV